MRTDSIFYQLFQIFPSLLFELKVLELIEGILIYKFTTLNRQEIEAMFGLSDLKQTRFYQEAKEDGKLETVPLLLQLGLSIEQIAERLGLDITAVSRVSQASAGDTPEG